MAYRLPAISSAVTEVAPAEFDQFMAERRTRPERTRLTRRAEDAKQNAAKRKTAMAYPTEKAVKVTGIGKITLPSYSMLALTLIGIAAAAYVARGNYTGAPLWCPILDGCNTVISSPYSRIFGVPMSYFGFIYYLFMFGLAARLAYEPFSNNLRFRAILYAALGAVSSIYFMYLQLGFIREICSYCLISAVTSFLLLFAALWHFQVTRHRALK
jgi:uncharacterized membrane protein